MSSTSWLAAKRCCSVEVIEEFGKSWHSTIRSHPWHLLGIQQLLLAALAIHEQQGPTSAP
jgi:hypothetical protein